MNSDDPQSPPPAPWELCFTEDGLKYFYNTETSESVWELPAAPPHGGAGQAPSALPHSAPSFSPAVARDPVWELFTDDSGHPFYFNSSTGESKWAQPDDWTPLCTLSLLCMLCALASLSPPMHLRNHMLCDYDL